jgi:nicotinate dehydrogenase subunit A
VVEIEVNGCTRRCEAPAHGMAVFALRNELGLAGVRLGCGEGHCGACTVLVDGQPATTCDLPVWALEGKQVRTPEGVGTPEQPHPVQAALLEAQAGQCGYCLSGILMTAVALTERERPCTEQEVRTALDKHLCRCGSQHRILQAVMQAIAKVHAA